MNAFGDYLAHWVIGVVALIIWAFGASPWAVSMGVPASLQTFAAWVVPTIVGAVIGHATATSAFNQSAVQIAAPVVPAFVPEVSIPTASIAPTA